MNNGRNSMHCRSAAYLRSLPLYSCSTTSIKEQRLLIASKFRILKRLTCRRSLLLQCRVFLAFKWYYAHCCWWLLKLNYCTQITPPQVRHCYTSSSGGPGYTCPAIVGAPPRTHASPVTKPRQGRRTRQLFSGRGRCARGQMLASVSHKCSSSLLCNEWYHRTHFSISMNLEIRRPQSSTQLTLHTILRRWIGLAKTCRDNAETADAWTPVTDALVIDTGTAVQRVRHAPSTTSMIEHAPGRLIILW